MSDDLISREKAIAISKVCYRVAENMEELGVAYEDNLKAMPSAFEGMKQGDIIEALFPVEGIYKDVDFIEVVFKGGTHTTYFSRDFWDSPYKGDVQMTETMIENEYAKGEETEAEALKRGERMKPFIKVTGLTKDFFSDREYEQDIIIGLNQVSAIYEERIVIGEKQYLKLTPDSMKSLKEYIECADCTGKGDSE